ncbi:MAG: PrgI family protein [Clostridia bacterium]|nr:PrgI family protein [Clostridia bacterium]
MNIYKVPFDFTHEEKVFGGYLSFRQMLYLIVSVISVGILFISVPIVLKTIIFLSVVAMFITFAFLKVGNIYADKYFFDILKFIFRKKIFIFER